MAQVSGPFDAGAGTAISEGQWQKISRAYLSTGVVPRLGSLAVTPGAGLTVSVATGQAQVEGIFYENDAALVLTLTAANATNPRIDTVAVRLDRTANTATLVAIAGTAAAAPVAPTLSLTDTLYEMALVNVTVPAAAGTIVAGNIADRRVLVKNFSGGAGVMLVSESDATLARDAGAVYVGNIAFDNAKVQIQATVAAPKALVARGRAGGTENIADFQNSAGLPLVAVGAAGRLRFDASLNGGAVGTATNSVIVEIGGVAYRLWASA